MSYRTVEGNHIELTRSQFVLCVVLHIFPAFTAWTVCGTLITIIIDNIIIWAQNHRSGCLFERSCSFQINLKWNTECTPVPWIYIKGIIKVCFSSISELNTIRTIDITGTRTGSLQNKIIGSQLCSFVNRKMSAYFNRRSNYFYIPGYGIIILNNHIQGNSIVLSHISCITLY